MFLRLIRRLTGGKRRVAAIALAGAAALLRAQEGGLARGTPKDFASPVYSRDNAVTVFAPLAKAGYRAPVLVFVDRTREELQRAVRLKLGSARCPLEVVLGGKSDGDTRVLTARFRDEAGRYRERIELPDPEAADLGRFRRAVFVALLRAWMVEAGGTDATMRELPNWLIDGLLRHSSRTTLQADTDRVLLLWSRACLPTASELYAFDSVAAVREPALAALLAAWFLEKRAEGAPFETLLRALAGGTAWDVGKISVLLSGSADPAVFDEALDFRFLAEGRQVITPGVTTQGVVRRFRSHLLLYPLDCGKFMRLFERGVTLQEAAANAGVPAIRESARKQAMVLRMAALGRDGMLLAVSDAYVCFLEEVARGGKQGDLSRYLVEAERMRHTLERKTAGGEVLKRSVGEEAVQRLEK